MKRLTRRGFLALGGAAVASGVIVGSSSSLALRRLQVVSIANPLEDYPNRDWEKVYRDQYGYDDSFTWVCSPNDTHACRLRAFTRNGVVTRIEQNYDVDRYTDLLGNKATAHWNPRRLREGPDHAPPRLRTLPAPAPDGAAGVEAVGGRRLP